MKTFNLLFKMPEDKELFVAAWAAISHYDRKIRTLGFPLQMTVIAKDDWLTKLLIPPMIFVTDKVEETVGMKFDLVVDFADDRILDLAKYGKKAASICAAFLGIEDYVNELVTLKTYEPHWDVCIIPWSEASVSLFDRIKDRFPDMDKILNAPSNAIDAILRSKIVVGYRSVETYLAASTNKTVLEGYDLETYDRNFLTKWSNPRYNMVCVEKKQDLDTNLSLIWRALERAINALQRIPRTESVTYSYTES